MNRVSKDLIEACKEKLLETKMDVLNRTRTNHSHLLDSSSEKGGDEADQTSRQLEESHAVLNHMRLREFLKEIEYALARIQNGTYGICEETSDPIEPARLIAIPWTRLSIEGAEIRESVSKKYAK